MLSVKQGTVKSFHKDKGWGFLVPEDGSRDVFFHIQYHSGLIEKWPGELDYENPSAPMHGGEAILVEKEEEVRQNLERGDTLIFESYNGPRGIMALHWMRPSTLERAKKMLAMRQGADNAYTRVMKSGTRAVRYRAECIWKGTSEEFRKKLDEGFKEMHDCRYYVEELKITGIWERVYHPNGWHPKYKAPYGDKLPGTRIRLHTPKVRGIGLEGVIRGINGEFVDSEDGLFKNPSYGVVLDGQPGVIESFRRSDFDIISPVS